MLVIVVWVFHFHRILDTVTCNGLCIMYLLLCIREYNLNVALLIRHKYESFTAA